MTMPTMMMSRADLKSCTEECEKRVYCRSFGFRSQFQSITNDVVNIIK